jgi:hypothetical protein
MKKIFFTTMVFAAFLFVFATTSFAQGGKAEPSRIKFKKGAASAVVFANLKQNVTAEYVFAAKKGQRVRVKISSTPKGKFHIFKVIGAEGINYSSELDINYDETFTAPATGDYVVSVDLRPTDKVRAAKFALTVTITN